MAAANVGAAALRHGKERPGIPQLNKQITAATRKGYKVQKQSEAIGGCGVLLDLAPPFKFFQEDEFARFSATAERCGAIRLPIEASNRSEFTVYVSDKAKYFYIAPKAAMLLAAGELDEYISCGCLEDRIPIHLRGEGMLRHMIDACELKSVRNGDDRWHPIPSTPVVVQHVESLLTSRIDRFLANGEPLARLMKAVSAASQLQLPTGDSVKNRLTSLVSPLERPQILSSADRAALGLEGPKTTLPPASLVIGIDRRSGPEPVAFVPVELARRTDSSIRLRLPARPMGFVLTSRVLEDNAEALDDVRTHLVDLDIPLITPWQIGYAHVLAQIATAISSALARPAVPIETITLRDGDDRKGLLCWIEVPGQRRPTSSSLIQLDRLSLLRDPALKAPGLQPLAGHAQGGAPPAGSVINHARRLTHSDGRFPLDPYQTRAAAAVASLQGRWAQSVTGPPGTGKTSMMRDVISDEVANSHLEDRPPSLLLAGPTVQAYRNLLGALDFDWGTKPSDWPELLLDYRHIGAIIPTKRSLENDPPDEAAPSIRFERSNGASSPHEGYAVLELPLDAGRIVGDPTTIDFISTVLPNGKEPFFGEDAADAECTVLLGRIRDIQAFLPTVLAAAATDDDLAALDWPPSLKSIRAIFEDRLADSDRSDPIRAVDAALDTTVRNLAFHLTFRFSQARFVVAAHDCRRFLANNAQYWKYDTPPGRAMTKDYLAFIKNAVACLLPVRTSTVFSMGGKAQEQFGKAAGLVVVDEAGMMEPEWVPCVMSEGVRTLVVGDPYQIGPIGIDRLPVLGALMSRAEIAPETVALWRNVILPSADGGPDARGGNGLSIIEALSPYRGEQALVLLRHYRCPASIIEIANELVYRPRHIPLEAMRPDSEVAPSELPIIGTVLHEGEPIEHENFNPTEAEAIVQTFIIHHRAILALGNGAPDASAIDLERDIGLMTGAAAFISPYRRQTKLDRLGDGLRSHLSRLYASYLPEGSDVIYEGFLPNLMLARLKSELPGCEHRVRAAVEGTVFGTVHALQGAERPLVFLSCVAATKTGFFNREAALVNVAVTRAKSHLVIARSVDLGKDDAADTPARRVAETVTRSRVLMPKSLIVVESREKGRTIARAAGALAKVVTTRGSIGQVSGVGPAGDPVVDIAPSTPRVAAELEAAAWWLRPEDEGGFGVKTLVLATDADDEGEVIAHDLVRQLHLTDGEIRRRGLTITRWPLEDPAALGDELLAEIGAARNFTPEITGRWRAVRQRARTELRIAVSRAMAAELRRKHAHRYPPIAVLRTMRWLDERERSGFELHASIADPNGRSIEAVLAEGPGAPIRFATEADAQTAATSLMEHIGLDVATLAVPSPLRTRRSLYDVLSTLSWAGIPPLRAMKVLQRLFETDPRNLS